MKKDKFIMSMKGITLIALVVTIVVLLILAGVSIQMLGREDGIIKQAVDAKDNTRGTSVQEAVDLWLTDRNFDNTMGQSEKTLETILSELELQGLITAEEKNQIEENGHIKIGSKDIAFANGLETQTYTIVSSDDEVYFDKAVKEGYILATKPEYTSYSIIGVSTEKGGESISSGSIAGKSGNLEIVGDIQDATFKYTLTDFMQGDETFYLKINIDGDIYYEELKVIQGDEVTYEENFIGIRL